MVCKTREVTRGWYFKGSQLLDHIQTDLSFPIQQDTPLGNYDFKLEYGTMCA